MIENNVYKKMTGIWIDKEFKKEYFDSSKSGLRLFCSKNILSENKQKIINYINYLRKLYFFPIRCNIKFYNETSFKSSDGKTRCKGIFFEGDEKEFPSIVCPLKLTSKYLIEDAMFNLTSLLTYYFQ